MSESISIAVCAYNSDPRLLSRLLSAIRNLSGIDAVESVLLIDNNSSPPLKKLDCVGHFLELNRTRYLLEQNQGLTNARCRAIAETSSDVVVFFDDDNEPSPEYLEILIEFFKKYPNVGVWGPGTIKVEFVDETSNEIQNRPDLFQERTRAFAFACAPGDYSQSTPNGTGFAIRRSALIQYANAVARGEISANDRCGASLSSAGDVQMVWEATKLGYACGVIPQLQCRHLIARNKSCLRYLKKLSFGCAASYLPALVESFPSTPTPRSITMDVVYMDYMKYMLKRVIRRRTVVEDAVQFGRKLGHAFGVARVLKSRNEGAILSLAKRAGFL